MAEFCAIEAPGYDDRMKKKYLWIEFSSAELARSVNHSSVAILPLAAIEQHGPHLPLGVDLYLVEAFIHEAMKSIDCQDSFIVAPSLQVGLSVEHLGFPGTLSLSVDACFDQSMAIAKAVAQAGIKKLLLFNAHGGNAGFMDLVGRQMRSEFGLQVFHSNWYDLAEPALMLDLFGQRELRFGVHAGDIETSLMMAIRADLVNGACLSLHVSNAEKKAEAFSILGDGRSAKQSWLVEDYSGSGAMGNAAAASLEKGQRLLGHVGLRLLNLLREIGRFAG